MTVVALRKPSLDAIAAARRLRDEAVDSAHALAEALTTEADVFASRCAEASQIDTMPAGLRDALKKLGMEVASRAHSMKAIQGTRP